MCFLFLRQGQILLIVLLDLFVYCIGVVVLSDCPCFSIIMTQSVSHSEVIDVETVSFSCPFCRS